MIALNDLSIVMNYQLSIAPLKNYNWTVKVTVNDKVSMTR